jgi:hypothetical protein
LNSVGIGGKESEIRFTQRRDDRHNGLYLITRHFRAEQDLSATVASREIPMHTPDAFRWLLRDQGRLEIVRGFESPDARFLTAICRK